MEVWSDLKFSEFAYFTKLSPVWPKPIFADILDEIC